MDILIRLSRLRPEACLALAFGLLSIAGFSSCEVSGRGTECVTILIPLLPEALSRLGPVELRLSWRDEQARLRDLAVTPGATVEISLPRGHYRSVLVEARYRGRPLRPAGAIYPDSMSSPLPPFVPYSAHLEPTWELGWVSSVVRVLEESSDSLGYDYCRLAALAASRLEDPWVVDPRLVAKALVDGSFRSDLLREKEPRELLLPGPGPWYPESPFAELPEPTEAGYRITLSLGLWHFYSQELELFIACAADMDAVILVRPLP